MRSERESTRIVRSWLEDGSTAVPDRVLDAVLSQLPSTPQRRSRWTPWRSPTMNLFLKAGAVAAVIAVAVIVGVSVLPRTPTPGASDGAPSGPVKGHVEFTLDGASSTIDIDGTADGSVLAGTAELSYGKGDATVELRCLANDGARWAFAGTYSATTTGTTVGEFMAIFVEDGAPQRVAIIEDGPGTTDCLTFLGDIPLADIPADEFLPVDAGEISLPTTP